MTLSSMDKQVITKGSFTLGQKRGIFALVLAISSVMKNFSGS